MPTDKAATAPPKLHAEEPQALIGYRSNAEWDALVSETGDRLAALEGMDEDVRAATFAAMDGIDAIHREALHRLVRLFKEGVLEQVITDPAINTLMGMYDLLPPETPGCAKIWDFLPDQDIASDGLAADPVGTPPHWSPAPLAGELAEGAFAIVRMEEGMIVVARAGGEIYSFSATCPHHNASMREGSLNGFSWACPSETGCLYDIRSGSRLGGGPPLGCHPVRTENGRVLIGFSMPFNAKLPVF